MAENDIVLRIQADVVRAVEALQGIGRSLEGLKNSAEAFEKAASPAFEKTTGILDGFWRKLTEVATGGEFLGHQLSEVFDSIKEGVQKAVEFLPELAEKTAEAGEHFKVMSQQTGASVTALSELAYAASSTGTSIEAVTSAMFLSQRQISAATTEARAAVKQLGLSFTELQTLAPEDQFLALIKALGQLPSNADRARLGFELFGRQFRSISQLTQADITALMAKSDALGTTFSAATAEMAAKFGDAQKEFHAVFTGLENEIGAALLPAATRAFEGAAEIFHKFITDLHLDSVAFGEAASVGVERTLKAFGEFAEAITPLARSVINFVNQALNLLPPALNAIADALELVVPLLEGLANALEKLGPIGTAAVVGLGLVGVKMGVLTGIMEGLSLGATALGVYLLDLGEVLAGFLSLTEIGAMFTAFWDVLVAGIGVAVAPLTEALTALSVVMGVTLGGAVAAVLIAFGALVAIAGVAYVAYRLWTRGQKDATDAAKDQAEASKKVQEQFDKEAKRVKELSAETLAYYEQGKLSTERVAQIAREAAELERLGHALDPILKALVDSEKVRRAAEKTPFEVPSLSPQQLEALKDIDAKIQASRVQATEEGLQQRLHLQDIEAAEALRKAKEQYSNYKDGQEAINKVAAEQAAKRAEILASAEREVAQQIEGIHAAETAEIAKRNKEGLEAQILDIQLAATREIEAERHKYGESKEALEAYNKWAAERQAQADIAIESARIAARKAANDQLRAANEQLIRAQIAATTIGEQQQLAIIEADRQQQLFEKTKGVNDEKALADIIVAVNTEAATKVFKVRTDSAKATRAALIDLEQKTQELLINLTEDGVQKAIDLENLRYNNEIIKAVESGNINAAELKKRQEIHELTLAQISLSDSKYSGDVILDSHLRGQKTKEDLDVELAVEESHLDDMLRNRDDFTAAAIDAQRKIVHEARVAAAGESTAWLDALTQIGEHFKALGQITGGAFGPILTAAGALVENLRQAAFESVETGSKFGILGEATADWKTNTEKAAGAMQIAATVAQGIQSVMQATAAHASAAANAFGGAVAGAQAGAAFGPWGIAIGAAAGLVVGIIRGAPEWAKAASDVGRDFGVKISDSLAKALEETEKKEHVGRLTAALLHLGDIIKEGGGLSPSNLSTFTQKLHDVFSEIDRGALKTEQATKIIDDVWPQMTAVIVKNGGLITQQMLEIIQLNDRFGTNSEQIASFVTAQFDKVAKGVKASVSSLPALIDIIGVAPKEFSTPEQIDAWIKAPEQMDKIHQAAAQNQDDFNRLSTITLAAFNGMIANGKSAVEAMDAIGDSVDILDNRYKTLGFESNAAFEQLDSFRGLVQANRPLVDAVGTLNDVLQGLANTGSLTEDAFLAIEQQGEEAFTKLQAAGFTDQQALQQLLPTLKTILLLHQQRGLAIDDETQKLIDQAEKQGLFAKDELDTNSILREGLSEIIRLLGGQIPEAWKKAAQAANDATEQMQKGLDSVADSIDRVNFGASPGGIKEIPIQLGYASDAADRFTQNFTGAMGEAYLAANRVKFGEMGGQIRAPKIVGPDTGGEPEGGGGDTVNLKIEINSLDSASVESAMERKFLPALQKVLERGRGLREFRHIILSGALS